MRFRRLDGREATCDATSWIRSVLALVERVEAFYGASARKDTIADALDRRGWEAFWADWASRKPAAL